MKHLRLNISIVASLILSSQLALADVKTYLDIEMGRIKKIENTSQKIEEARRLFKDFFELQRGRTNIFVAVQLGMDPSNPVYINRYDYNNFKTFKEFTDYYESKAYIGEATSFDKNMSQKLVDIAKRVEDHRLIVEYVYDVTDFTKKEITKKEARGYKLKFGFGSFYMEEPSTKGGEGLPLLSDVVNFLKEASSKVQSEQYTVEVLFPIFKALFNMKKTEIHWQLVNILKDDIWPRHRPVLLRFFLDLEDVNFNKSIIFAVLSKESWEKGYPEYEQLIESLVDSEAYDEHLVRYVFTQGRLKNRADLVLKIFARDQVNDEFIFGLSDLSKNSSKESNLVPTIISGLIDRTDPAEAKRNIYEILHSMAERTDFWLNYQSSFFDVANKAIDLDNPEYKESPIELSTYWVIKTLALQPVLARSPEGGRLIRRINRMKFLTSNMDEFDDLVDIALNSAQFQPASCIEWFMRSQY